MAKQRQETSIVKEALKALPYRTKVRHGKGTARGWIHIYLPRSIWNRDRRYVEGIIAQKLGRNQVTENRIMVAWYEPYEDEN